MTIEPKLMNATEVAEWSRVALLANPIERSAVQKLLSHIAAQDRRIAELEEERWSLMTQLSGANRSLRENGIDPYAGLP